MKRLSSYAAVCSAIVAWGSTGCALLQGGGRDPAARVSLTGDWTLEEAHSSDTAHASVRALGRQHDGSADDGAATNRPGTYADRLRTARMDRDLAERIVAAARQRIERLAIADSGDVIRLQSGERDPVVLTPDGSTSRLVWLDGTSSELRARWVEQRLEIVRHLDDAITVQEYYSRSPGGTRLVVFTIVKGPFAGEITVRRVYELVG